MSIKEWIDPEKSHISLAKDIGDKIYSMDNKLHMEILEEIRQRLIKLKQKDLEMLRKFNRL